MSSEISRAFRGTAFWGLRRAPADAVRGRMVEQAWRWPTVLALACTIPAFYLEMLHAQRSALADATYLTAAIVVAVALLHTGWRSQHLAKHVQANPMDLLLVLGLLFAAALPPSISSAAVLSLRLVVSFISLLRMVWALQHLITRGGLAYMLMAAAAVLALCGAGYWWLEPTTPTLGEGMWLAFVTAATVGYGDYVPTTTASRIFSVFVVMLGFGVLSLVTAAIATRWIETEERIIEREIMRDVHQQMNALRHDIVALRAELIRVREQAPFVPPPGAAETGIET
jgi:voltage-gated potassium channel